MLVTIPIGLWLFFVCDLLFLFTGAYPSVARGQLPIREVLPIGDPGERRLS